MSMTYTSLVAQITSYLNRTDADTIAQIPNFISQAEQRICRESENVGFEIYVTGSFTSSVSVLQKPGRWRRNLTFNIGTGTDYNTRQQLLLRGYEYLRNYWPDDTQTGTPLFYGDYGYNNLLFAPTPDVAYPFEFAYLELPEPLSTTVSTNWLTDYAPDVLLLASLLEAMPYLKNSEKIPEWSTLYQERIMGLNKQDTERVTDRAAIRKEGG